MITREKYLAKLRNLRDQNVVKVVTGIRRSGKSTLLNQYKDELLASGISQKQIVALNLEEMENEALLERHILNDYIMRLADPTMQTYVFLDEIQNVPQFEKLIDSLQVKPFLDIYLTGSNAYMLSSDIATLLSGRYIEISILPFSFIEFSQYYQDAQKQDVFQDYLEFGGFPEVSNFLHGGARSETGDYLANVYRTVLEKDITQRKEIRSKTDFDNVLRFALDSIGSLVSPNSIANTLKGNQGGASRFTVGGYLSALADCFVLYKTHRFDVKGKKILQTLNKFYCVDIGLARHILGKDSSVNRGHLLENVVFLELLRRNVGVWTGKTGPAEIDFVVRTRAGSTEYYQVSETMAHQATRERELKSLKSIGDNNRKFVLTMDSGEFSYDGIQQFNVIDWLSTEQS